MKTWLMNILKFLGFYKEVNSLTVAQVKDGITLCHENAYRLLRDAEMLLDADSFGNAYALWSLAVEEYGKAIILSGRVNDLKDSEIILLPGWLFHNHPKRFKPGFRGLADVQGIRIVWVVDVLSNTSPISIAIQYPRQPKAVVSIASMTTGQFEDTSQITEIPSDKLRNKLFYVDWDESRKLWLIPETKIIRPGVNALFRISGKELKTLFQALRVMLERQ